MVAHDEETLETAIKYAERTLTELGFGLYSPESASDKAARGECKNGINFLGCMIQPNRCVPSKKSISNLKKNVADILSKSKSDIKNYLTTGKIFSSRYSHSSTIDTIGKHIYGWQKSFAFCNKRGDFERIDKYCGSS